MRVKTKYGHGTLIAISAIEQHIGYKVLLDNEFPSDLYGEDLELTEVFPIKNRIYGCRHITALTEQGEEVQFGQWEIKRIAATPIEPTQCPST